MSEGSVAAPSMIYLILTRSVWVFLVFATLFPLISLGQWWIRLYDFPRIQIAIIAIALLLTLLFGSRQRSPGKNFLLITTAAVIVWQLWHVVKYSPLYPTELPAATANDDCVTSTVVNLQFENNQHQQVLQQLEGLHNDLLLLIEVNQAWADSLKPLESQYPFRVGQVAEDGLGIVLLSKYEIENEQVRHLVSDKRPSIRADIKLPNGEILKFVGLHPTPPGLEEEDGQERHDSRIRDAELMLIAKEVADDSNSKWIVTGDFNDVAWSHTTRLFKRMSGLKDPRVGRGLFNSYHADIPLLRFPIDQVFLSPGAGIIEMTRFLPEGSDHFAITTSFSTTGLYSADPEPSGNDKVDASQIIRDGHEDAQEASENEPQPAE